MKRRILWTQTTTYASEVQVSVAQVARWAAGAKILRTQTPGRPQHHPSPAQIERMMNANAHFHEFVTAAYCQDLGLLREADASRLSTGAPSIRRRPG